MAILAPGTGLIGRLRDALHRTQHVSQGGRVDHRGRCAQRGPPGRRVTGRSISALPVMFVSGDNWSR
jgi:hypothetical protein